MSVVEIVQLDHWRYKINLSTDDHKHLLTLPDSNWYSLEQTKKVIDNLGTTGVILSSLQENDKKFFLGVI